MFPVQLLTRSHFLVLMWAIIKYLLNYLSKVKQFWIFPVFTKFGHTNVLNVNYEGTTLKPPATEQFLAYETGLLSGLFFKVLGDKDIESFRSACIKSLFIILAMVTTKSLRVYSTKLMTVGWREDLCKSIHKLYLTGISFYRLVMLDNQELDNPDQRITSDCSSITSAS